MVTLRDVKQTVSADSYSVKNGVFTIREGFFYSHGRTEDMLAAKVRAAFADVVIVDLGRVDKLFRGGAGVAQNSHFFVKFTFNTEAR